ncbi:predicted protein [Postia placenta Mad-698-R]|uniref:Uncharacterized protein n=1 Tax=Postia placenta MAD-698-R-SB12 TaxID=670580 RepID=A0A1X6NHI4_9APHY|nr:hypothetical protein POSPLADRAFT_1130121 [Postia placenta MAD-698-R-SB12]EED82532.1 predicted protein [Postia placenta Mad-698-R]OSX67906.1 hypothetical protein POSPLADRAFT_1130121 [Postia placenta MAD-698-R-SB12]
MTCRYAAGLRSAGREADQKASGRKVDLVQVGNRTRAIGASGSITYRLAKAGWAGSGRWDYGHGCVGALEQPLETQGMRPGREHVTTARAVGMCGGGANSSTIHLGWSVKQSARVG